MILVFPKLLDDFLCQICSVYRVIFEEKITPVILDVEEKSQHKGDVHGKDEDHNRQTSVNSHSLLVTGGNTRRHNRRTRSSSV